MLNLRLCICAIVAHSFVLTTVQSFENISSYLEFSTLAKESSYVDKSLFIKEILKDQGQKIVLTAPRGFGKTTNIEMLKAFFKLEVNAIGDKVTWLRDMNEPIDDTPNYDIFKHLKINEDTDIMMQHFGKYPVIHIDFKLAVGFLFFNETQDRMRDVLHNTISEHSYLKESGKLYEEEKEFIRVWSSDQYKSEDMGTLIPGLEKLSKYLFKHFDRSKVLVLIDHYDSPILYCVTHPNVAQDAFNYVVNVIQAFFSIPKDDFYVDTFLLTGVLQVEEAHVSNAKVIKRYQFLREHRFVPYFGFTEDEVFDLLGRYTIDVDNDLFESVQEHYGGYESLANLTVLNPWAVVNYLVKKKLDHDWARTVDIPNLQGLLKIPDIHQKLERMLKDLPTVMELKRSSSYENLKVLRDLVNEPYGKGHLWYTTLFYTFIFEQGFLAFDSSVVSAVSDARRYLFPNKEVKSFLLETLKR